MTWLLAHAQTIVFTGALLGVGVGFALERPSLGLIVPCGLVLSLMVAWRWRQGTPGKGEGDA